VDSCLEYHPTRTVSHLDLENKHQLSSEPQGRSCLTGFSLFMRHVTLWDLEQKGKIVYVPFNLIQTAVVILFVFSINEEEWASTDYGDAPESASPSTAPFETRLTSRL
jgi:hypothetical protein